MRSGSIDSISETVVFLSIDSPPLFDSGHVVASIARAFHWSPVSLHDLYLCFVRSFSSIPFILLVAHATQVVNQPNRRQWTMPTKKRRRRRRRHRPSANAI